MTTAFAQTSREEAFADFKKQHPDFEKTETIDALRTREYSRLDLLGQVYLDYTGGGIYSDYQLEEHLNLLKNQEN